MAQQKTEKARNTVDRDLLIKDTNIWTPNGFSKGSILVRDGKIVRIGRKFEKEVETVNGSGLYALPGLIDVHVHLRDMKLSYKEDFGTGTTAAAAGGFTTVLDMPNTVPPTDSPGRLRDKRKRAAKKTLVNVGFHAAASPDPKTVAGLAREGAFSLKLYMPRAISPLDVSDDKEIRKLMLAARQSGLPVTVHAEEMPASRGQGRVESFEQLANLRGPILETRAVERIGRLQLGTGCKVHFCHLTLASSLRRVVAESSKLTSEVTPHHLILSQRDLKRLSWKGWMVPPLRANSDRHALLAATIGGGCDVLASDHAPHAIREKKLRPEASVPGVPGLETTLPLMLTLVNKGILTLPRLVKMLAENPARIFKLHSKGKIQRGYDADVVLIDPRKKSRIDPSRFFSKAKFSPFDGFKTKGAVSSAIVGGIPVFDQGEIVAKEGCGTVLRSSHVG